ncbi:cytochrome P450 [Stachybotrys elegans]|uniref:Cytochrome P450 n=1 Tax=Stachybotrys elegans TaxID=80388 RepID=A0A8K0WN43_9HYPO|nr:cytochrome P450 [Stachybotrys elegans]
MSWKDFVPGFPYIAAITATYVLLLSGYRIFLHPLSKYPGPLLAKVSGSYSAFYAVQKRLHLVTRENHVKFGPIIRMGPNKLVFNSVQALHDIYDSDRVTKSQAYLATRLSPSFNIFNAIDEDLHRTKRKVIGQVVSERSMRIFEPTMQGQIDEFIKHLRHCSLESSPVNMTDRCRYLGMDVVGHLAFGYDLETQTSPTNHHLITALGHANWRLNTYIQWSFLAKLHLEVVVVIFYLLKKGSHLRLLDRMMKLREKQEPDAHHDLYSIVAGSTKNSNNEGIPLKDIWAEAFFFFPAGGETSVTAMCSLFFYLSRNPGCYQKLAEEIRSTFQSGEEIKGGAKLSGCRYLRASIDEALRMSPPTPGTLWRQQIAGDNESQPLIIGGHPIPKGVEFGVNTYSIQHNEELFPESFSFKPERWLPDYTPKEQIKEMSRAFASFSLGPRGCAGKAMAYLEISLVMAKVLWNFDFEKAPGELGETGCMHGRKGEYGIQDIFTSDHDGPYLLFRERTE